MDMKDMSYIPLQLGDIAITTNHFYLDFGFRLVVIGIPFIWYFPTLFILVMSKKTIKLFFL